MANSKRGEDRGLGDVLAVLRARWQWVVVALVVAFILALYLTASTPVKYEAAARVLVGSTAAQEAVAGRLNLDTDVEERDLVNQIDVARSDGVQALVRERLSIAPGEELPEGKITADVASDVLTFEFEAPTAQEASFTANTWATAYVDFKRLSAQESIDRVVETLQAELAEHRTDREALRADLQGLEDRLARTTDPIVQAELQLDIDREESSISGDLAILDAQIAASVDGIAELELSRELAGSAEVVQTAAVPTEPATAPLSRNLVAGAALGLVLGVMLALLLDSLDTSIRTTDDIQALGLASLGQIPRAPRSQRRAMATIVGSDPGGVYADGYQRVRSAVDFVAMDRRIKTVLVTSPGPGDGKSTTAVNLALAYASAGAKVMLTDVDLRRPRLHEIFRMPLSPGVGDLHQIRPGRLSELARTVIGNRHELLAIPAGTAPPDPAGYLASSLVNPYIQRLGESVHITLLDAPPALAAADVVSLAPAVDGVIVVANAGKTTNDELIETVDYVRRAGGHLLGVVLNRAAPQRKNSGYYAQSGPQSPDMLSPAVTAAPPAAENPAQESSATSPRPVPDRTGQIVLPDSARGAATVTTSNATPTNGHGGGTSAAGNRSPAQNGGTAGSDRNGPARPHDRAATTTRTDLGTPSPAPKATEPRSDASRKQTAANGGSTDGRSSTGSGGGASGSSGSDEKPTGSGNGSGTGDSAGPATERPVGADLLGDDLLDVLVDED